MASLEKKDSSSKKGASSKGVLAGVIFVLLAGGGAYLSFFKTSGALSRKEIQIPKGFQAEINAETPSSETNGANHKDSGGGGHGKAHKPAEEQLNFLEPPFFRLPTMRVPIVRHGKLFAYMYLKVEMEADSHETFDLAKFLMPRLVDRVFSDLYVAMATLWIETVEPSSEAIKERVYAVTKQILGKGKIKTIYVSQILIDRL